MNFLALSLKKIRLGFFSKPVDGKARPTPEQYVLQDLDRVEIYRPLLIDPEKARVERASKKVSMTLREAFK